MWFMLRFPHRFVALTLTRLLFALLFNRSCFNVLSTLCRQLCEKQWKTSSKLYYLFCLFSQRTHKRAPHNMTIKCSPDPAQHKLDILAIFSAYTLTIMFQVLVLFFVLFLYFYFFLFSRPPRLLFSLFSSSASSTATRRCSRVKTGNIKLLRLNVCWFSLTLLSNRCWSVLQRWWWSR